MLREELIFVGTCDIAGHVRGKGFPARELAARKKRGIGWTHSNLMQNAFGVILDTPFGTGGDLMVVPDHERRGARRFRRRLGGRALLSRRHPQHRRHSLGNAARASSCAAPSPRSMPQAGCTSSPPSSRSSVYTGVEERPGHAYSLGAWRRQGSVRRKRRRRAPRRRAQALTPSCPNMARANTRLTIAPQPALKAADQAVIARELTRATAFRLGHRVSFSPMPGGRRHRQRRAYPFQPA